MLSASTSARRRQYGTTNRSARRRSWSSTARLSPRGGLLAGSARDRRRRRRQDEELGRLIAVDGDRSQILIRRSVVEIDRVAGDVDVEDLAVGTRLQPHPRPAFELGA